ncbi:putative ubiquitin conjugation factor E4 B [Rosellinia necatrix]|uniref:Putative ubiquitin conjugation factor E4 B n=1 Tax=Rosellinia necatrix TaxID=77044 RepID=A0A1S7UK51_ROSNE|nr:putative ubiquitin conjugation factor E4 B [Rosellinia necatrix]
MDPSEQPEPTLPPAEQMRQRRLAKLASLNATSSSSASSSESPAPAQLPEPSASSPSSSNQPRGQPIRITPASKPKPESVPSTNPFSQLASKKAGSASTSVDSEAPVKKVHTATTESLVDWSDRVLSDVFLITLNEKRRTDTRGTTLTYLADLRSELEQSGEQVKLSASSIDAAILEATRHVPTNKPLLDYLLPCWKRVMRASRPSRRPPPEKEAVLHEARRLCMSNCIFALTMPEYFGREPDLNHDSLAPYLLRNHDNEDGICLDFFTEAISRMDDDDTIAPIFTEAMVIMSGQVSKMTMNDNYKPYINCLVTYARFPPLLEALAQHPKFQVQPKQDATKEELAKATETDTILGPFFRISPLQSEVTKTYFANPRTIDPGHVKSSQTALQMTLKAHQGDLISIINAFVRASPFAKNATLDWFAFGLNSNHKRRALQVKATEVASDGFMVNVTAILDKLCEPFMDATFSKINKIDLDYLRRTPRVDMSDETKLNADQATSDAFYNDKADGTSNFISEVFFLTLAAHHYGLGATNSKLKDLDKDIKYVEKVIKQMEEELPKVQNDPLRTAMAKKHIQTAVTTVEKYIALKHAIQAVVVDQGMQTLSLQFMRYVAVWLLRTASKTDYKPGEKIGLPLSSDKPAAFSCLPEYALQDVVENFKFVFRFLPNILMSAIGDEIIALCITFLRSSEYIKNPYLKSSLVTLLFSGTWPIYHLSRGVLGDSLMSSNFANEHLLHSLMKFYIECEHSGVSSAFYDKFNIRYEIFQVIKTIWPNNVYKEKLSRESKVNRQFFVQFVNLLLNDATYLLDEALTKLVKIHDYQKQLQNQGLSPEERDKLKTDLEQAEQQCQSWMQLVNDTMGMMKLFTETLRDSFTMPEIVVRLAGMLNYNLESLVGPKRGQLKVEDAKKYHFDPKTLLSDFIDVYLNLGSKPDFVKAVASDGRSYKPSNFEAASQLLQHSLGKPPEMVVSWNDLRKRVAEAKAELDQAELDLGDIPPEFEDPIMGDLMTDPVILPSRHIMDRSTIVQQLLSTPKDPFSNVQMTIDDVVPADDLRKQIEAWKAERIARAKENANRSSDLMDTSGD